MENNHPLYFFLYTNDNIFYSTIPSHYILSLLTFFLFFFLYLLPFFLPFFFFLLFLFFFLFSSFFLALVFFFYLSILSLFSSFYLSHPSSRPRRPLPLSTLLSRSLSYLADPRPPPPCASSCSLLVLSTGHHRAAAVRGISGVAAPVSYYWHGTR